ncbi:hypothetical protein DFH29DRAFT_1004348 [Suillus ampliporus]|nr:hypothetical protein DFH29DRAFT_1004348 [Suillus ampliporus]
MSIIVMISVPALIDQSIPMLYPSSSTANKVRESNHSASSLPRKPTPVHSSHPPSRYQTLCLLYTSTLLCIPPSSSSSLSTLTPPASLAVFPALSACGFLVTLP